MALLTAGYWPTTYWAENYWTDDYWPDAGVAVVGKTWMQKHRTVLMIIATEEE